MASRELKVEIIGDSRSLERAMGRADKSVSGLGRSFSRMGKLAVAGFAATGAAVGAGLAISVNKAVEFERSMRNVNTIAGLSEKQLGALEKQVLKLAGPVAQSPKILAAGLYDIVSSGFKAGDATKILAVSAKAASAGLTDTTTSVKAITASLNAYHLEAKDANKVSDILFTTVNKGVLTFEELAQNMGDMVPAAAPLGVSLEEVGASIATITLQGVPAAEAATRVKNTMLQLAKPSATLSKLFKEQGFASGEAAVKALGFSGVLQLIQKETQGSVTKTAALTPEIRALLGVVGLTGKNLKTYNENLKAMKESQEGVGATTKAFAEQAKSTGFQWDKLKTLLEVTAIRIGSALLPALNKIVTSINQNWPQIEAVVTRVMAAISEGAAKAAAAVRAHFEQIKVVVTQVFSGLKATIEGVANFLSTEWGRRLAIAAASTLIFAAAFMKVSAAVKVLSVTLTALKSNPYFLAAVALGAVVGIVTGDFIAQKFAAIELSQALDKAAGSTAELRAQQAALKDAALGVKEAKNAEAAAHRRTTQAVRDFQKVAADEKATALQRKDAFRAVTDAKLAEARATLTTEQAESRLNTEQSKRNQQFRDGVKGIQESRDKIAQWSDEVQKGEYITRQSREEGKKFSDSMGIVAREAVKVAQSVAKSDPVMARNKMQIANLASALRLWENQLKRVPSKTEINAVAKIVGKPDFDKKLRAIIENIKAGKPLAEKGGREVGEAGPKAIKKGIDAERGAAVGGARGLGSSVGSGYVGGMASWIPMAITTAAALVTSSIQSMHAVAKNPPPPSGATIPIGESHAAGYTKGIKDKTPEAAKASADMVKTSGEKAAAEAAGAAKKVTDALLMGYLNGTASLPDKLSERMTKAIDRAKAAVEAQKAKFDEAWSRLAGDALAAFDAKTNAGLARIQARLQVQLDAIDAQLTKALKKVEGKRAAKTPAEKALEALDKGETQRSLQKAATDANEALRQAKAGVGFEPKEGETPEEAAKRVADQGKAIADAEEQRRQAALAIQRDALQTQADAERTAADKLATDATEFQTKKANKAKTDAEKESGEETKQYQAKRDLRRRHLEDFLAMQQKILDREPKQWEEVHQRVMTKFREEFGPNFKTAGTNLGSAFVIGLKQSFKAMDSTAQELARLIAKYLKSNSPPEKGELSDIDKWGNALIIDQFIGNIDMDKVDKEMVKIGKGVADGFWRGLEESSPSTGMATTTDFLRAALGLPTGGGDVSSSAKAAAAAAGEEIGHTTGTAFVEAVKGPITEGGISGTGSGERKTRGAMGKEGSMPKQITEDEIMGDKPGWADQEIWGLLGKMAVAEGKWAELLDAVQRGSFKSNAGLIDQLFRRRTRWNWNDPSFSPRLRRMFELMSGPEGWSGKQVADYFGLLAKGGIITKPGMYFGGEKGPEAVIPLRSSRGDRMLGGGVNVTVNVAGYVGNERQLAQQLAPAFMEAMRRQQGNGSPSLTRMR